jgi:hypothetical protein
MSLDYVVQIKCQQMPYAVRYSNFCKGRNFRPVALLELIFLVQWNRDSSVGKVARLHAGRPGSWGSISIWTYDFSLNRNIAVTVRPDFESRYGTYKKVYLWHLPAWCRYHFHQRIRLNGCWSLLAVQVFGRNLSLWRTNFFCVVFKNQVRTSQETHYVSTTKPNRLLLFGETVAVCCENHTEHTDTLCGENAVLFF